MKTVAIIQARVGSTRLPAKVLADLAGDCMLARVVERTRRSRQLDEVVVATTTEAADEAIASLCRERGWPCFRGSENDVVDRYYRAASNSKAEVVVRITSDCPFIDPALMDALIEKFAQERADYCATAGYPRGLDCEVFTVAALEKAFASATGYQRVHITPYMYENPTLFRCVEMKAEADYGGLRWTVDTEEDLLFARAVYERLQGDNSGWRDVLRIVQEEPSLCDLNRHVRQKTLAEC